MAVLCWFNHLSQQGVEFYQVNILKSNFNENCNSFLYPKLCKFFVRKRINISLFQSLWERRSYIWLASRFRYMVSLEHVSYLVHRILYLVKFSKRKAKTHLERARDLFEIGIESAPPKYKKLLFLMYADL